MFNMENMKPVAYHKYTSSVRQRIYESDDMVEMYQEYKTYLLETFKEAGIRSWNDNKIVFEMEFEGKRIFFGFYDSMFSVGFSVHHWN